MLQLTIQIGPLECFVLPPFVLPVGSLPEGSMSQIQNIFENVQSNVSGYIGTDTHAPRKKKKKKIFKSTAAQKTTRPCVH